jgi:hypothetical protein
MRQRLEITHRKGSGFSDLRTTRNFTTMAPRTLEELEAELKEDTKVKVAGIDADGVLRGKVMAKSKFMSAAKSGFGFCRLGESGLS